RRRALRAFFCVTQRGGHYGRRRALRAFFCVTQRGGPFGHRWTKDADTATGPLTRHLSWSPDRPLPFVRQRVFRSPVRSALAPSALVAACVHHLDRLVDCQKTAWEARVQDLAEGVLALPLHHIEWSADEIVHPFLARHQFGEVGGV